MGCSLNYPNKIDEASNTSEYTKVENKNEEFSLKEKCSKYIVAEKERFNDENPGFSTKFYANLDGIFFSRTYNTCVAKWQWFNGETLAQFYSYEDVLTDQNLKSIHPFEIDQNGNLQIDIIRDSELVNREAKLYEATLDLIK